MGYISFIFCTFIISTYFKHLTHSYSCSKYIEVYGVADKLGVTMYSSLLPSYTAYRKRFGVNVTVNVVPSTSAPTAYFKQGLIDAPYYIKPGLPILFVHTPFDFVPLHDNDISFPVAAQGIAIIYNIPGVTNFNLSTRAVGDIFYGKIQTWSDSILKRYNPNAYLPNDTIMPVARLDGGGTTVYFTTTLSQANPTWNASFGIFGSPSFVNGICCNSTTWPNNVPYMFANELVGMVGVVTSLPNTIGYAALGGLAQYSTNVAGLLISLQNLSTVVWPTALTIQQKMHAFVNDSNSNDVSIKVDVGFDRGAYPLTIFSYLVMNFTYNSKIDCCVIQELVGFMDWMFSDEADKILIGMGYQPVIEELATRIRKAVLSKVKCVEGYVYDNYLASLTISSGKKTLASWVVAVIIICCSLAIIIIAFICFFIYRKYFYIDEKRWLINMERMNFGSKELHRKRRNNEVQSLTSKGSQSEMKQIRENFQVNRDLMAIAELDENLVLLDCLNCKEPKQWSRISKLALSKFLQLTNTNIASLIGICQYEYQSGAVFEFCSKGSLHHVLKTSRYELSKDIKYQFALDVANGLLYLHSNNMVHGYLNSTSCYLDGSWCVKICQWEKISLYQNTYQQELITYFTYVPMATVPDEFRLLQLLYMDPTILNKIHPSVDVFSYGMLLVEIFTRKLPYCNLVANGMITYPEILSRKFGHFHIAPMESQNVMMEFQHVYEKCVAKSDTRVNMSQVLNILKSFPSHSSNGVVDIIMDVMEKHAEALEIKVNERTAELKQITDKMQHLLHEVLPSQIADKLLNGQIVLPEHFDCVTVLFTDIVGFTTISARSTPIEVMNFLNDLWLTFDTAIEKFDVYKVDTIGDAYMVCSGLPTRNGFEHCRQIALLSLALLAKCQTFKMKHLPSDQLKMRIGVNSGPVTAGVVGSKMPQYCVFGDTVNTASRMESTSMPQRVHITEATKLLLDEHFPREFATEFRGDVDVKGKGSMKTFWLSGRLRKEE